NFLSKRNNSIIIKNRKAHIGYTDVFYNMSQELEPEDKQINLLEQVVSKLDDLKILLEKARPKEEPDNRWHWIDNKELEKLLGLHERTLATWRENGTLRFTRIGKKIFYNRKEIEQLLWQKFGRELEL